MSVIIVDEKYLNKIKNEERIVKLDPKTSSFINPFDLEEDFFEEKNKKEKKRKEEYNKKIEEISKEIEASLDKFNEVPKDFVKKWTKELKELEKNDRDNT